MKKYFYFLLFLINVFSSQAQLNYKWSLSTGSSLTDRIHIFSDKSSNIYGVGLARPGADLDPGPGVAGPSGYVNFIVKYDSAGNMLLYKEFGSASPPNYISPIGWLTDNQNNVYILGNIHGTIDLDLDSGVYLLSGTTNSWTFIAKYNSNMQLMWAKSMGPLWGSFYLNNTNDKIIFSGYADGAVDLIPGPVDSIFNLNNQAIIVEYDTAANFISFRQLLNSYGPINCTQQDNAGNFYCLGYSTSGLSSDFDLGPGVHYGMFQSYLCKYDSAFNFIKVVGWNYENCIVSLIADEGERIYIQLVLRGPMDVDPGSGVHTYAPMDGSDMNLIMLCLDTAFNFIWSKHLGSNFPNSPGYQAINNSNSIFYSGIYRDTLYEDEHPILISNGADDLFLIEVDTSGYIRSKHTLGGSGYYDFFYSIIIKDSLIYLGGSLDGNFDFDFGPNVSASSANGYGDIALMCYSYSNNSGIISGNVFSDNNSNGIRDTGETGLSGIIIEINPGPAYCSTDTVGNFMTYIFPGHYTLTIPSIPNNYLQSNPSSHSANIPGAFSSDTGNMFALVPKSNIFNLSIDLIEPNVIRTQNPYSILIDYKNKGTVSVAAEISLINHNSDIPINVNPPTTVIVGDTMRWLIPQLNPLQNGSINVEYFCSDSSGGLLNFDGMIGPIILDQFPSDNNDSINTFIVGSFDPNDKSVQPSIDLDSAFVNEEKYLEYTIRFQNTGTDTAFKIVIIDSLSSNLYIPSFEFVSASHNCTYNISGNGVATFEFRNILLPDSNINEPLSHGYIVYKLKIKGSIQRGSTILNTAYIYFDFNQPVATNTTVSHYPFTPYVNEISNTLNIKYFPNPFTTNLFISLNENNKSTVEIHDISGRIIIHQKDFYHTTTINFENITSGVYILIVKCGDLISRSLIVKDN